MTHVALLLLALTTAALVAAMIGTAAGCLARIDGATLPSAIHRGAVTFGATLTLLLGVLSLMGSLLR
jgi:hypothetical protein